MALRKAVPATLTFMLLSTAGCQSSGPADDVHRRLELELRRACVAWAGGPSADAVDLFAGRMHTACFRWAHREARRLLPR